MHDNLWLNVKQICIVIFNTLIMTSSNGNFFHVTGLCAGKSPAPGEFPAQRPVTRSFDVSFDLRRNKRLNKQSWGWWFVALFCQLKHQCNARNSIACCMHVDSMHTGYEYFNNCLFVTKYMAFGKMCSKTVCQFRNKHRIQSIYWYPIIDVICIVNCADLISISHNGTSNGNNFRVGDPLCGKFNCHRWIPFTKASDAELWCFFFDLRLG